MTLTKPQIEMLRRLANGRRIIVDSILVHWSNDFEPVFRPTLRILEKHGLVDSDAHTRVISDAGRAALAEAEKSKCG